MISGRIIGYTFEEHYALRYRNAQQLSQFMKYLHNKYSCMVFGFDDMNATVYEDVFNVYADSSIKKPLKR